MPFMWGRTWNDPGWTRHAQTGGFHCVLTDSCMGGGGGWNAMREVSAYVTVLESADKLALLVRGLDNGD